MQAGVIVIRKVSLVVLLCVIALSLAATGLAQAQDVTVTRSIQPDSVPAGGGVVTVTIGINGNYGVGSVVEKLPPDFTYVEGSVTPSDITDITLDLDENTVTFPLVGESSFSYQVNTSSSSGQHQFPTGSQLTYGVAKVMAPVGGASSVTVEQAQEPSVTVTRSINPDSVPAGGGVVTVTIDINGSYGIGSVVEKLPPDFTYVEGSVTPSDITDITLDLDENTVTFPLVGESSFSYQVNTSSSSGQHQFPTGSQLTYGVAKVMAPVGGASSVTVEQAQEPSVTVTRSINPDSVPAGGGVVTVTIDINGNYGIGSVVEKLPPDFTYVEGSVTPSDITDITLDLDENTVTFPLVGESSFSYQVNTSSSSGQHQFPTGSQLTYGVAKVMAPVGGASSVTVEQAQEPSVTVTRSINPDSVPAGGGVVTVTIDINGNYGVGSVVEKLPPDFTYVEGSVTPSDITDITLDLDENTVTFPLVGESSFSYQVNTSSSSGQHQFPTGSQLTYGVAKVVAPVGGASSVTVRGADPGPDPEPQGNRPPAFTEGSATTRTVAENTVAGGDIGNPVAANDANGDALTYALGGTDAASFDIDPATGQLMTLAALDYEAKASYEVTVTATDPEGASDMTTVTVTVTNEEETGEVTLWAGDGCPHDGAAG